MPLQSTASAQKTVIDYVARYARLQQAMKKSGFAVIIVEPGAAMEYFLGVNWGRSERSFLAIIPSAGEPSYVLPAFEEMRARELIHLGDQIRTWEEDVSPYEKAAGVLTEIKMSASRIGVESSLRFFIFDGIRRTLPQADFQDAEPALELAGMTT